ncbi:MAG: polysaccharide pyruvyl transferase family protein [Bacillaceae bacterium]|nr:polysaccharide pyruvyl transferase family protein [Bacillaceae bacterium]
MDRRDNKYFIALSGAKKNVGDFLITYRAVNLLKNVAPEYEFIIYPHWKEFENIEFVNKSEGIIILGGPGFQINMYPGVYKLVKNLEDIKVPIYILGSGWKGIPGDKVTEKLYSFSSSSKELLKKMDSNYAGMSCRDYQTQRVLKNNGYKNITMTGCPAWYDLDSTGKEFIAPKKIEKIVFTPAQNELFSEQSIKVLEYIKDRYKGVELIVSFHRGIGKVDQYTNEIDARNTQKMADKAISMGAKVIDVSYDVGKLHLYDDCHLHIGYRVHAHIYFLSKRLPSILLHEDGRGNGVSEALKTPGINAYRIPKMYSHIFNLFRVNTLIASVYGRLGLKINESIIHDLDCLITELEDTQYKCFQKTSQYIDEHYKVMEKFIKRMIYKREM